MNNKLTRFTWLLFLLLRKCFSIFPGSAPLKKLRQFTSFTVLHLLTILSLCAPGSSFADVPLEPGVNLKSLFYDFALMAETGTTFTALGTGPSINAAGMVAFQAQNNSGPGIWTSNGHVTTDLTPLFHTATRAFGRAVMLTDSGNVIESDSAPGFTIPFTFVRTWSGSGSGAFDTLGRGGTGQIYEAVLSFPAVSADGFSWAFTALTTTSNLPSLVTPLDTIPLMGNQGVGYRPKVAKNGSVVLHDSNTSSQQIQIFRNGANNLELVASSTDKFTLLGNQPDISDSGKIIAFSGDRGNGPGIFIAYEQSPSNWKITQIAGEGAAAQGNRPDLGFDVDDNPIFFSSIDFSSRVAVIHQERLSSGLNGDTVVVSFIGTPSGFSTYPRSGNYPGLFFRQALGIWTVRLDFYLDIDSHLQIRKRYAIPVAQIGDTISGDGISNFVIASLSIHDPLSEAATDDLSVPLTYSAGAHRIAFWASNSGGERVILRGTHVNSCLLAIRHFSQCDTRWKTQPLYAFSTDTLCAKACALTSLTMAANYAADFYNIVAVATPLDVQNTILPLGGFNSESGVNWQTSIPALKTPSGLLAQKPNTLRYLANTVLVTPSSSQAKVYKAYSDIDGNLCHDENPAPFVVGVNRKFNITHNNIIPGHFIALSGRVNNRRFISDPGHNAAILFSQGNVDNLISSRYDNSFETRGVVVDPVDLGGMTISVSGAATFHVTNPLGQQAGFIAGSNEPIQEISGGTFFVDGLSNIETDGPVENIVSSFLMNETSMVPYTVEVIGKETGNFTMAVESINFDGSLMPPVSLTEAITLNQVKIFIVTPNSGGVSVVPGASSAQVATPNVVGQTQASAQAAIVAAGLTVGTVTQQSSSSVPSGSVISQNPAAATNVAAGSAVLLVVSSGTACSLSVDDHITITRGGFQLNRITKRYVQQVTVKNTGNAPILGPVSLVLDGVSSNSTLFNAIGSTICALPVSPYVSVNVGPDNVFSIGESVIILLEFVNPTNQGINYSTRVLSGSPQ